jgi:hypothetical protein
MIGDPMKSVPVFINHDYRNLVGRLEIIEEAYNVLASGEPMVLSSGIDASGNVIEVSIMPQPYPAVSRDEVEALVMSNLARENVERFKQKLREISQRGGR